MNTWKTKNSLKGKNKPGSFRKPDAAMKKKFTDKQLNILHAAGYTHDDLYREFWPTGIANLLLWRKEDLTVKLDGSTLLFSWTNYHTGRQIMQSCRPERKTHGINHKHIRNRMLYMADDIDPAPR